MADEEGREAEMHEAARKMEGVRRMRGSGDGGRGTVEEIKIID